VWIALWSPHRRRGKSLPPIIDAMMQVADMQVVDMQVAALGTAAAARED